MFEDGAGRLYRHGLGLLSLSRPAREQFACGWLAWVSIVVSEDVDVCCTLEMNGSLGY